MLNDIRALGASMFKVTSWFRSLRTLSRCLQGCKTDNTSSRAYWSIILIKRSWMIGHDYQGNPYIAIR